MVNIMFDGVIDIGFLKSITAPSSNYVSLLPVQSENCNFISKIQHPSLV